MTVRRPLPLGLRQPGQLLQRLHQSTVVWSWAYNGLRLAAGLILLPLVFRKLSEADLGMYYVLLTLVNLVPLVDFGFGSTVSRFVSYAMGGAETIQAHGVPKPGPSACPNHALLWQLLYTTRRLYAYLSLVLLVLLGLWGTCMVELRIHETSSVLLTRLAWAVTLTAAAFDIYSNWWAVYLRSMNEVLWSTRLLVLGIGVRLVVAATLLLCGANLLSLPIGSFCGSLVQRWLARRRCLQLLAAHPAPAQAEVAHYLRLLWPNSWRLGVQVLGYAFTAQANTYICLHVLRLAAYGQYGLSVQLLNLISGMASVWTWVKWPLLGQYLARQDTLALQRVLWPRIWLQSLSFCAAAAGLLLFGPWLMAHVGHGKTILPGLWLGLLALNSFLEMQYSLWTTLISMQNRLPYLWPSVATNLLSLVLSVSLIRFTTLGLGALVLGPLLAGSVFNYWFWPPVAARSVGTPLLRFLLCGPPSAKAQELVPVGSA